MARYQQLTVWQYSFKLSVQIYKITSAYPQSELYGLVSQMRRAAVSIPSNIAEGNLRGHKLEYIQFIKIAQGSLAELETQILISKELDYIKTESFNSILDLVAEVGKMLNGLLKSLNK